MIGGKQMNEFVNDDKFAKGFRKAEEMRVHRETASRGHGSPLPLHGTHLYLWAADTDSCRPMPHGPTKLLSILPSVTRTLVRSLTWRFLHTLCNFRSLFATSIIFAVPTIGRRDL
jgi:hypothetical protein